VIAAGAHAGRAGPLFADDQDDVALQQDLYRRDGHAGQVHQDLDRLIRFQHVKRGHTVADRRRGAGRGVAQLLKQPPDIVGQVAKLA
jgi:hypothetical protein